MAFNVPFGTSAEDFPAIVTVPGLEECLYCLWLPLVLERLQPSFSSIFSSSFTFISYASVSVVLDCRITPRISGKMARSVHFVRLHALVMCIQLLPTPMTEKGNNSVPMILGNANPKTIPKTTPYSPHSPKVLIGIGPVVMKTLTRNPIQKPPKQPISAEVNRSLSVAGLCHQLLKCSILLEMDFFMI